MTIPDGIEFRCSDVLVRQKSVLLVHRTRGISQLDQRPPLAGHLRGMLGRRPLYAPYRANMWRPARRRRSSSDTASAAGATEAADVITGQVRGASS